MSDDLVKWLRQDAAEWEILDNTEAGTKLRAAADEIERLRAARDAALERALLVVDREYRRAVGPREAKALFDAMRAIRALKENT